LSRIASLTGGIGVIYVGGQTDLEQKELYDRVDDAVCAVRSALEEGILPGGGLALYKEATFVEDANGEVAGKILARALRAPLLQIYENAGLKLSVDEEQKLMYDEGTEGMNVKTGEWGDMYKMGVIDPLKVTRSALQNAVSVAVTILSTNAIITMARTYEEK
jgi:chaperonin GroEL